MTVPATDTPTTMNSVHTDAKDAACEPFAEESFVLALTNATRTSTAAKTWCFKRRGGGEGVEMAEAVRRAKGGAHARIKAFRESSRLNSRCQAGWNQQGKTGSRQ